MSESNGRVSGGIGFVGMLTVLLIGLKLTGTTTMSWFWVLSPMIFATGIIVLILVGFIIIAYLIDSGKI